MKNYNSIKGRISNLEKSINQFVVDLLLPEIANSCSLLRKNVLIDLK